MSIGPLETDGYATQCKAEESLGLEHKVLEKEPGVLQKKLAEAREAEWRARVEMKGKDRLSDCEKLYRELRRQVNPETFPVTIKILKDKGHAHLRSMGCPFFRLHDFC